MKYPSNIVVSFLRIVQLIGTNICWGSLVCLFFFWVFKCNFLMIWIIIRVSTKSCSCNYPALLALIRKCCLLHLVVSVIAKNKWMLKNDLQVKKEEKRKKPWSHFLWQIPVASFLPTLGICYLDKKKKNHSLGCMVLSYWFMVHRNVSLIIKNCTWWSVVLLINRAFSLDELS